MRLRRRFAAPEALEEIGALERQVDQLWKVYRGKDRGLSWGAV